MKYLDDLPAIVDAQFFGEHARTKSLVSSDVDTTEENEAMLPIVAAPQYQGEAEAAGLTIDNV
jgi:hypothetical protein